MSTNKSTTTGLANSKALDPTATLRQRRRREKLKKLDATPVLAYLLPEQKARLVALVAAGYAKTQEAALTKSIEEAFARLA